MCKNIKRQYEIESKEKATALTRGVNVCLENGPKRKSEDFVEKSMEILSSQKSTPSEEKTKEIISSSERKFKILVVDDNENIREMLEDFLNFEGHEPVLAKDGKEALQIFCEQDFDIVITDLGMPGMSGWELSKCIKQRKPETPIVIITGWGAQLEAENLKENKVESILTKPFNLDQVKQMIETVGAKLLKEEDAS
jgi:CheY-like chemotaxis protein